MTKTNDQLAVSHGPDYRRCDAERFSHMHNNCLDLHVLRTASAAAMDILWQRVPPPQETPTTHIYQAYSRSATAVTDAGEHGSFIRHV